jgi:hypothetical protein
MANGHPTKPPPNPGSGTGSGGKVTPAGGNDKPPQTKKITPAGGNDKPPQTKV